MVDRPLLGHVQGDDWPGSHHDLCGFLLSNSHKAMPIHPEQLISCLKTSIFPGSASLNHSFDVNPKAFLSNTFRSDNTQTHSVGLAQPDGLNFRFVRVMGSISINWTPYVLMRRAES